MDIRNIFGNGDTKFANTENDCLGWGVKPENFTDSCVKKIDIVAITLLTERSKTVEVLTNLTCGEVHTGGKFT